MSRKQRLVLFFCICIPLLVGDYLSKQWALCTLLPAGGTVSLLEGVVCFRFVRNTGAAFSMFTGASALLGIVGLAICAALLVLLFGKKPLPAVWVLGLTLCFCGGFANTLERLLRGYVVDFIHLQLFRFPTFNLADMAVCSGAALCMLALCLQKPQAREN